MTCGKWVVSLYSEKGIIFPMYKTGDWIDIRNYKRITLLNTAYKIYTMIVGERLAKDD